MQQASAIDVLSEDLLALGVSLETVTEFRLAEVEAMKQQTKASGLQLAGITNSIGALQQWMDSIEGFNRLAEEEARRPRPRTRLGKELGRRLLRRGPGQR